MALVGAHAHLLSCLVTTDFSITNFLGAVISHGKQAKWEKKSTFSCLLHDWPLYSMGIVIPSIHLVSFCLLELFFPYLIFFTPVLVLFVSCIWLRSPLFLSEIWSTEGTEVACRHWCIEVALSNVL